MKAIVMLLASLILAAAAPGGPLGTAEVSARLAPDGLRASVVLDRPVTRFSFAPADVVRESEFDLLTPGLTLKGDEITSARAFRRFELAIRPMTQERDAKYPAFYRVGEGGLLYGPALVAEPSAWRTRLRLVPAHGQVRLPASGDPANGFTFLGPKAQAVEHEEVSVVSAPGTPEWLVERTRTDLAAAVRDFTRSLDIALPYKPLLVVTHDDARTQVVADVTRPATVTVRFHGAPWRQPDPRAAELIQGLVLHEAFHLWNGALVGNGENTPAWLHEGGAEYASILAGRAVGAWDDADVRRRLGQALTSCRDALKDKPLAEAQLSAQVRYPCGTAIQWIADSHLRQKSGGRRNLLSAWGQVVRGALLRQDRSYTLEDFYSASGFSAETKPAAMTMVLQERGTERWDRLPASLESLGIDVGLESEPATRLRSVMFHILGQHCPKGEPIGYFDGEGESIKLDTEGRCGPLAGAPIVTAIEGRPLRDSTPQMYEAVSRKCASSAEVTFTTDDGRKSAARCAEPLPPPPLAYGVRSLRLGGKPD